MRKTLINVICLGALAALPLSGPILHAAIGGGTVVEAAMSGNREAVRALLKDGADVNTAQADGMTALHWAAQKGDVELAKVLLYASANMRATTRIGGYTPLLIASRNGDAAMIRTLLESGADANNQTTNGTTALMLAAAAGKAEAAKVLLEKGANVNAKENVKGETALTFAAAYGRADVVRELIAHHADVSVTTKVQDLAVFAEEEQKRLAELFALQGRGGRGEPGAGGRGRGPQGPQIAGVTRQYNYTELVGYWGGMSPLHMAARQGHIDVANALLDAGANVDQRSAGDQTTPLLIATINGHFDLAKQLLDKGADPNLPQGTNGVTPLYAALGCQWSDKALYPQPRAFEQQKTSYLDLMQALLDKGANPNARLTRKVWYSQYDFDQSGVDETGATPFFRAAYAADVDGMKLLVKYGADPSLRTMRTPGRVRTGDIVRDVQDVSPMPPVPPGGPALTALLAASGAGYGEGFAANHHHHAPGGMLPAVKYLVEELHVDVNAKDHDGNTAIHNAAARGDNEMILYLVSKGADVLQVNREGKTTVDMANGPVQRISPFPDTIKLLEGMGAKNNHKCVSC
jgi:ankyrin repeat protein